MFVPFPLSLSPKKPHLTILMEWPESHNLATQVFCSITFLLCLVDFNSDFQRLSSYSEENWLLTELIGFPCLQNRAQEEKRHRREEEGRDGTSRGVTALPHALPLISRPPPGATHSSTAHPRRHTPTEPIKLTYDREMGIS